jgi:hypothetical protein
MVYLQQFSCIINNYYVSIDACCGIKHVSNLTECFASPLNPCHAAHSTLQLEYDTTQISSTQFSVDGDEISFDVNDDMSERDKRQGIYLPSFSS